VKDTTQPGGHSYSSAEPAVSFELLRTAKRAALAEALQLLVNIWTWQLHNSNSCSENRQRCS
jgi:hypothetical protein